MRPEIRLTPPRRASRRIAGLVIPLEMSANVTRKVDWKGTYWMLSRKTFLCRLAPPFPRPFPPFPRPDIVIDLLFGGKGRVRGRSVRVLIDVLDKER
jgi:hypothetical protein